MKFLRRDWKRHSKLGKKRKKKQTWRRPTGRDNKMRERRKGYPKTVEIGYKNKDSKIKEIFVYNLDDFKKVKKGHKIFVGKVGKKKRMEILKKGREMKITFENLNINKTLKKLKSIKKIKKPVEKGK